MKRNAGPNQRGAIGCRASYRARPTRRAAAAGIRRSDALDIAITVHDQLTESVGMGGRPSRIRSAYRVRQKIVPVFANSPTSCTVRFVAP